MRTTTLAFAVSLVVLPHPANADEKPSNRQDGVPTFAADRARPRQRLTAAPQAGEQSKAAHPLDPLSAAEMAEAVAILRKARKLGPGYRFVSCTLEEPAKSVVVRHQPGKDYPRRA